MDSELFGDLGSDQIDQSDHIARFGAGVCHDEIGVAFTDFSPAHASPLHSRLFDQLPRALTAWIFEDTAGGLGTERLNGLFRNPVLLQHLCDRFGIVRAERLL